MEIEARLEAAMPLLEGSAVLALFFFTLALIEFAWDMTQRRWARIPETLANTGIALVNGLLDNTLWGALFVIGLFLAEFGAIAELPVNGWTWLAAIVLADLTYYLMHRVEHRVRLFWALHVVHHSSPCFDLTTAFRLSWFEGAVEWLFFAPLVLLGFDPVQVLIAVIVVVQYQAWIHTTKIGRLGPLEGVFNTPSAHRVHHGRNRRYLDRNFGGILMLWDRLFGTYEPEGEDVDYGITTPLNSRNPLVINGHEFVAIVRDVVAAPGWRNRMLTLFAPPGWRPQDGR